jgi:hypothetical protein
MVAQRACRIQRHEINGRRVQKWPDLAMNRDPRRMTMCPMRSPAGQSGADSRKFMKGGTTVDTFDLANAAVAEHERLVRQLLLERQARAASSDREGARSGFAGTRAWFPLPGRFTGHQ